jgi:hypothetical protein
MGKVFISYRRQDTRQIAGRIFDRLEAKFGKGNVFFDVDSIPFGVDFHDFLNAQVAQADTVLVLIGHGWADARDEAGARRLDNPDDFVRIEVEAALARNIPLGAVLIDGAPMPRAEQLPGSLRPLCRRNAAFLDSGRDFHVHMDRLIADLERHLQRTEAPPPEKPEAETKREAAKKTPALTVADVIARKGQWIKEFSIDFRASSAPSVFQHLFIVVDGHKSLSSGCILTGREWDRTSKPFWTVIHGKFTGEWSCISIYEIAYLGPHWRDEFFPISEDLMNKEKGEYKNSIVYAAK